MREKGVTPDKRHYAMAMFACVTAGQVGARRVCASGALFTYLLKGFTSCTQYSLISRPSLHLY